MAGESPTGTQAADRDSGARLRNAKIAALRERQSTTPPTPNATTNLPSTNSQIFNQPTPVNEFDTDANAGINAQFIINRQQALLARQAARQAQSKATATAILERGKGLVDEFRQALIALIKGGLSVISGTGADALTFITGITGSNAAGVVKLALSTDTDEPEDTQTQILRDIFLPKFGFEGGAIWNSLSAIFSLIWIPVALLLIAVVLMYMYDWYINNTWTGWFLSWAPSWLVGLVL